VLYAPFAGPRLGDSPGYIEPARAIRHGAYTTPLPAVDVTGLQIPSFAAGRPERQSYRPPGYPLVIAATGGGETRSATRALIAVQAILTGLAAILLTLAARALWSPRVGLAAGALVALDPWPKHYVPRVLSEAVAGFLFALCVYAFVRAWQSRSPPWWGAVGLSTGALALTRPLFGLVVPLALLAALATSAPARRRLAGAAAYAAGAALLLGPWVAWEADVAGKATLSSFGEGWNLLIGAYGEGLHRTAVEVESSPAYRRDFDSVHRLAPSARIVARDPEAHPHYLARADAEQRRLAWHRYGVRLRHEPLDVLGESVYRGYFLWMAHEDWVQPSWLLPLLRAVDWASLALALAGVLLALAARGPPRALGLFLVLFTLVNAIHHVEARYAMPVRGLYVSFIALALATLASRATAWKESRQQERGEPERRGREVADRGEVGLGQAEHDARTEH
jgi:4-amino-4-deoxy-L-arabinose transferase-like glycosyltransferase